MFCFVHTDQWSADTGFIGDDDQEIEDLNDELKTLVAPEVQAIIDKLSVNKKLMQAIKKSVQQQLTINIEAENLGKIS